MSKSTPVLTFLVVAFTVVACVQLETLSTSRYIGQSFGYSGSERRSGSNPLNLRNLADSASLGAASSFREATGRAVTNAKGLARKRLLQTYAGYDVYGSSVEAEMDLSGRYSGQMYGEVARDLHKDIPDPNACMRNGSDLFNAVIIMEGHDPINVTMTRSEAVRLVFLDTNEHKGKLAYKVSFMLRNKNNISKPVYYLDACTDDILLNFNGIRTFQRRKLYYDETDISPVGLENATVYPADDATADVTPCSPSAVGLGGNGKIGLRAYNVPPFCLNVRSEGGNCQMIGKYAMVVDNLKSDSSAKTDAVVFNCSEGYRDGVNDGYGPANDAFYFAEEFGRFLELRYNFRISDSVLRYVVHYGDSVGDSFYDYESFYFGDGDGFFYPLTDLDSVVHETARAITFHHSGLPAVEQTGGIDESFADISGEVLKQFIYVRNDWLHGWNVWKLKGALRFFKDPTDDSVSIKNVLSYRRGLNVQYSSGIFNHAFYRLVVTERMNIFDAYKCFLDANLLLWSPFTTFRKAACHVMQACYDNGFDHRKVRRAFYRVGIPLFLCEYSALATSIHVGESLKSVLVGNNRRPIFRAELGLSEGESFQITAYFGERPVQIDIARDDNIFLKIATGFGKVTFTNSYAYVYVRLSLSETSETDVRVTMSFLP